MSSNIGFGRVRKKVEGPYVTKLNGPHVTIGSEKTGCGGTREFSRRHVAGSNALQQMDLKDRKGWSKDFGFRV